MILDYVLILASIVAMLILLRVLTVKKRPLRSVFYGGMKGFAALATVNLAGLLTGIAIPVSILTLGITFVCGLPGVVAMLALNLIFSM